MVHTRLPRTVAVLLAASLVAGCATRVPLLRQAGETEQAEIARESRLVGHVRCELKQAVIRIEEEGRLNPNSGGNSAAWLSGWGAKVTLTLQVEDAFALAPNLNYLDPRRNVIDTFPTGGNVTTGQSFSTALAVTGSAKATRTETISFYFPFAELLREDDAAGLRFEQKVATPCAEADKSNMEGDLRVYDFMRSKVNMARLPGLIPQADGASPFDTFNYQVAFVVARGASANPSWKLLPVSYDTANLSLVSGSRTRTNTLLLTMGKAPAGKPSKELEDSHTAKLIGQEVSAAIARESR